MRDYVYLCREGDNEELRYSIRSVVKNMPPGNVWIVGGTPSWYTGNHIAVNQNLAKTRNVTNSLAVICNSDQISQEFVLMNDDFFILNKVKTINDYHGGSLQSKADEYKELQPASSYTRSLQETCDRLLRLGVTDPLDYELHVPMVMNRDGLSKALRRKGLWRSTFGNLFKIGGSQITDVKVYDSGPLTKRSYVYEDTTFPYISSDDSSFESLLKPKLEKMFPVPSPYEKA